MHCNAIRREMVDVPILEIQRVGKKTDETRVKFILWLVNESLLIFRN